ncbi:sugar ABC transporter substrate-binding protein [Oscillospiraceae bacterium PP1C4]
MKKHTRILSSILAIVMAFSMAACTKDTPAPSASSEKPASASEAAKSEAPASEASTDKQKTVAVLMPGSVGYFVATKAGMDKAAAEYNLKLEYSDAQWDASKQLSQVEDAITKGVDLIAVCAADADAIKPAIKSANDAGIPILAFVNAIGDDPTGKYEGLVSYVGQSEIATGGLCAKIAKQLLGEKGGNIVLIEGRPGTYPQRYRREGFTNAIKDTPAMKVVYTQTSNWEKEEALKITEDLIQKGTQFDLIFAQDDNSATGAGKALKEAGLKDKVKVIGLGGSIDGLQALKDGVIDATTFMSAEEEGRLAIETAAKFLKGESVEAVTEIKQVEVNADNVDTFKGEW